VLVGAAEILHVAVMAPEKPFTHSIPINALAVPGGLAMVVSVPGFKTK
jgi:hypothetical protein